MNFFPRLFHVSLAVAFLFLAFLSTYMLAVFFENHNAGGSIDKGAIYFCLSACCLNAGCFMIGLSADDFKLWLHKITVIACIVAGLFALTASAYSFIVWLWVRNSHSLVIGIPPLAASCLTFIFFFGMVKTLKDLFEEHQDLKVIAQIHKNIAAA